ncbi:MAG: caspase family protein [Chitinispirillaceae bacterium]|nr:caspase family protein [Chitinispirillaceae bacterium]
MNSRGTLLFILLLAGVTSAARFALLIGNAHGGSDVVTLKFVDNDLKAIRSTLSGYCGFSRENIISITGKGPAEVDEALDRLRCVLPEGEENLLLLYYTGHADQENLKMGETRFPITEMKSRFSAFPASIRIGIFDACQSGSFTRLKGGKLAEPFLFKDMEKIKGEVILSSSSPTENAQESDLYGNSIFTFHFVNALRGSGDLSGDGKVTLSEAYQYTYNRTVSSTARTWGGVQHPSYQFRIQGEGDVVLADLTVGTMGVLLEGSVAGDVAMFDSSNNIVADCAKEQGSRMIIALNPGTYQIVVGTSDSRKWKTTVAVREKELVTVQMKQFQKIDPERTLHKGKTDERFRIGVAVVGVYGRFDLWSYAADLRSAFAGFNRFGIAPVFINDMNGPFGGIGLRIRVRECYIGSFGYSWLSRERRGHYSGSFSTDGGDRDYGATLDNDERFALGIFEWGTGYHFTQRYVRGLVLQVGMNCYRVDLSMESAFADELYDMTSSVDYRDGGLLWLPWIGGGYSYTFARNFEVAFFARYRYQREPKQLGPGIFENLFGNEPSDDHRKLSYNFRGIDVSLAVSVNLIWRGDGE